MRKALTHGNTFITQEAFWCGAPRSVGVSVGGRPCTCTSHALPKMRVADAETVPQSRNALATVAEELHASSSHTSLREASPLHARTRSLRLAMRLAVPFVLL